MMMLFKRSEYDDDVVVRNIRVWWCCCCSKNQSMMMMLLFERSEYYDDVADRKVKVLKMMLLIERSKCWRCCYWSKGQRCCWSKRSKMLLIETVKFVADRSGQGVAVAKDWRLKMKTTWCWKGFQWFIDVLPWWCWWCSLSLIIVVVDIVVEYPSR